MISKIIILLSLIIYSFTDEEDYVINEDGESCENAPENPETEEDCNIYHTESLSCCFVTIIHDDNSIENKCWEFKKDLRYFLNYLNVFSYKGYNNIKANFSCNQIDQSCGINSPKELYECSEHSSKSKSCCLLKTPTSSNCILSQKKYTETTNVTIFDNYYVTCFGNNLSIKFIYLILLYLL